MWYQYTLQQNAIQNTAYTRYVNRIANGNSQIESPQKCYFGTPELTLIFIEKYPSHTVVLCTRRNNSKIHIMKVHSHPISLRVP